MIELLMAFSFGDGEENEENKNPLPSSSKRRFCYS
jgi:hypothetical protein